MSQQNSSNLTQTEGIAALAVMAGMSFFGAHALYNRFDFRDDDRPVAKAEAKDEWITLSAPQKGNFRIEFQQLTKND